MESAYAPPPHDPPELLPPNRQRSRLSWWWVAVLVVFGSLGGILLKLGTPSPSPPTRVPDVRSAEDVPAWPLLIPVVTALSLAFVFWRVRARLPAKDRRGLLRFEPVPPKPEASDSPPFEPLDLVGTSLQRPVRLRIDGEGFHWAAETVPLLQAQWLEVGWLELSACDTSRHRSPLSTGGPCFVIIGIGLLQASLVPALTAIVAGALMVIIGRTKAMGSLTIITDSHTLTFTSSQFDGPTRERFLAAARARRPELFARKRPGDGGLLRGLFGQPFVELAVALRSDRWIRGRLAAEAPVPVDEETAAAAAVRRRLSGLWDSGFCALGPVSFGLALGLMYGTWASALGGYGIAWTIGLILSVRLMSILARLSGMTLPAKRLNLS